MLARTENLPVLPQVVSQVLKLIDGPGASPRELESVIEKDPAVAAKILRVAGSSYYGSLPAETLNRAISLLGLTTVKNLSIGIAYQQMIGTKQVSLRFNRVEFWKHSLAVAIISRAIGKIRSLSYSEELYFAGMVHDIGLLVLDRFTPGELDNVIEIAREQEILFAEAEMLANGISHTDAGWFLANKWTLSPIQVSIIHHHHEPEKSEEAYRLANWIASVADTLAHECGYINQCPKDCKLELTETQIAQLEIPFEQYDSIRQFAINEVSKIANSLGVAA